MGPICHRPIGAYRVRALGCGCHPSGCPSERTRGDGTGAWVRRSEGEAGAGSEGAALALAAQPRRPAPPLPRRPPRLAPPPPSPSGPARGRPASPPHFSPPTNPPRRRPRLCREQCLADRIGFRAKVNPRSGDKFHLSP